MIGKKGEDEGEGIDYEQELSLVKEQGCRIKRAQLESSQMLMENEGDDRMVTERDRKCTGAEWLSAHSC